MELALSFDNNLNEYLARGLNSKLFGIRLFRCTNKSINLI